MKPLRFKNLRVVCLFATLTALQINAEERRELRVGIAGHAFEHLGGIADQAEAAAASGATIIYAGGMGEMGYNGLPKLEGLTAFAAERSSYVRRAKTKTRLSAFVS